MRQVLIRFAPNDPWAQGMVAKDAAEAWTAAMLARSHGFQTKVVPFGRRARDAGESFDRYRAATLSALDTMGAPVTVAVTE